MVETEIDEGREVIARSELLTGPDKKEGARKLIAQISRSLIPAYWATEDERSKLSDLEWDSDTDISGDIELFSSNVGGYASQIEHAGYLSNLDLATGDGYLNLWRLQIFGERDFDNWFFSSPNDFPKLKAYVQKLDYLRLLLINYVETYLLPEQQAEAGSGQPLAVTTTPQPQ